MSERYQSVSLDTAELVVKSSENGELTPRDRGLFLGGIFSAGGMINLKLEQSKYRSGTYLRVRPIINYADGRAKKIERLKETFGGKILRQSGKNSHRWYLSDHEAVRFASQMKGFAPSRAAAIEAFEL